MSKNKLNDYIIKDVIGEGTFGKVKVAYNIKDKTNYALKIINKEKLKTRLKNKQYKEIELMSRLNHINVVFLYDIIEDKDNYYLITEYCKQGELFDYIINKGRLSENESSILFYQLINGVEYIHSKNIVHRDLKPENLLLTEDGTLKIIDFGLGHEYFKDNKKLLETACGSPFYAPPELIMGIPYNGFKADVWCCGIILYNMLCGSFPFDSEDKKILFQKICFSEVVYHEFLSEESIQLLKMLLKKNPDKRISIEDIKKNKFYLKGKTLCNLNYNKIEEKIIKKRTNKFISNQKENKTEGKINIAISKAKLAKYFKNPKETPKIRIITNSSSPVNTKANTNQNSKENIKESKLERNNYFSSPRKNIKLKLDELSIYKNLIQKNGCNLLGKTPKLKLINLKKNNNIQLSVMSNKNIENIPKFMHEFKLTNDLVTSINKIFNKNKDSSKNISPDSYKYCIYLKHNELHSKTNSCQISKIISSKEPVLTTNNININIYNKINTTSFGDKENFNSPFNKSSKYISLITKRKSCKKNKINNDFNKGNYFNLVKRCNTKEKDKLIFSYFNKNKSLKHKDNLSLFTNID